MKKILISPNALKGSLSAKAAATIIGKAFADVSPDFVCVLAPIADGGDSTLEVVATQYPPNALQTILVSDPVGNPISAQWLSLPNNTALIELAQASGIAKIPISQRNPTLTTTYGTGQIIAEALRQGKTHIFIAIGGSATVDGGIGILAALGFDFFDVTGKILSPCGGNLQQIHSIKNDLIVPPNVQFTILCDVENPLLGENGSAAVFAPQKGASPDQITLLEDGLAHFASLALRDTGKDITAVRHGGAAGGVAAGLHAYLGAQLVAGFEWVQLAIQLDTKMQEIDFVVTAEGRLDTQSLGGKGTDGVAVLAKKYGKPCIGLFGSLPPVAERAKFTNFTAMFALPDKPMNLTEAITETPELLYGIAKQVAQLLYLK
jgi:glycerate 2-kinase